MTVALHRQGAYAWDDFRDRLVAHIAAAGGTDTPAGAGITYYEQWLTSFERLLVEKGILSAAEIEVRKDAFATGERTEVY